MQRIRDSSWDPEAALVLAELLLTGRGLQGSLHISDSSEGSGPGHRNEGAQRRAKLS